MGASKQKLIGAIEHSYLYWEEVPRDVLVRLGIDGMAPASGPICGDYGAHKERRPDGGTGELSA